MATHALAGHAPEQLPGQPLRCAARRPVADGIVNADATGAIIGYNGSANMAVLFDGDSPAFAGQVLNVHPGDLKLATKGEDHAE